MQDRLRLTGDGGQEMGEKLFEETPGVFEFHSASKYRG
jgi:hypothetical protein